MSIFQDFRYFNIPQGTIINYNNFLSFLLIGMVFADIAFVVQYYFFYDPVVIVILVLGLGGLLIGNLLGRFLQERHRNFRSIFTVCEVSYLLLLILYFLREIIEYQNSKLLVLLFFSLKLLIPILIFITSLLIGIKINYSLRVSCTEFIDKKPGIGLFIGFMLAAVSLGIIVSGIFYSLNIPAAFMIAVPILILPSIVLVNLQRNRAFLYEKDFEEEIAGDAASAPRRDNDNLIFIYLNFFYIVMYSYLGFSSIIKYYGNSAYVELMFVLVLLLLMLAGYIAGRYIVISNLYIYGGSLFPVGFLVFLILLLRWHGSLYFFGGILLIAPAAFVMGVVLNSTVRVIAGRYDDAKRATIIEFAIVIVPTSILVSLAIINFTNLWYYVVLGVLMICNVIIPAIYMANTTTAAYKKALYFAFSLVFLPLFFFIISYYNISLNSNVYVTRAGNFDVLFDVNYDADYIKKDAVVTLGNSPVFHVADSVIRNLKRSLVPVSLFHKDEKKILFIDSNQKFFRNPVIGYYENSNCLDVLSDRDVDYNKLPLTGNQGYVPDKGDLLFYFEHTGNRFFTIVDIPNILDQNYNPFRFSGEYYALIKKRLENNGIFVQTFNISDSRRELFSFAVSNLQRSFKRQCVFLFSNILVIMSSDGDKAFDLKQGNYARLIKFYTTHEELSGVFLNEVHVLSHLVYADISGMLPLIPAGKLLPVLYLAPPEALRLKQKFFSDYIGNNTGALDLIDKSPDQYYFYRTINNLFLPNDSILTLLKKTELAEAFGKYHDETQYLFELKKQAEFRIDLQNYIFKMLKYKEKYYYDLALRFEKNKKWEEAKELYKTVLAINNDNFDANYRMGLLCIILQDIDGSFRYLQQAMRINKDHPKVLFQMGILYFSTGKITDAVEYFNRALQQNEKSPSIYRYLGLCYQQLGNLYDAEKYFSKALLADPNDVDSKRRLDEVRSLIEKENKKWETPEQKNESDVEQDAEMPLPVSKGAYDIRLKDNDMSLPVMDPQTGERIQGAEEKK